MQANSAPRATVGLMPGSDARQNEVNRDFTTVGGGWVTGLSWGLSVAYNPGCEPCDTGNATGWRPGKRRSLLFYDNWTHSQADFDYGSARATVR